MYNIQRYKRMHSENYISLLSLSPESRGCLFQEELVLSRCHHFAVTRLPLNLHYLSAWPLRHLSLPPSLFYSFSSTFPQHLAQYSHFHTDFFIGLPSRLGSSQIHKVKACVLFGVCILLPRILLDSKYTRFVELTNEKIVYYFQGPGLRCDTNSNLVR